MEIIIGKYAGFCYGVRKAVEGLEKIVDENNNQPIKCYGEIVHNNSVVKDFERKKVEFIEDLNKVNKEDKVIIRAHGIRKEDYELLKEKQVEFKDFTCHNVLKVHEIVNENKDSLIILTGDKNHPENIGTISYAEEIIVINDPNELGDEEVINRIINSKRNKVLLISQTTYSMEKFQIITNLLEQIIKKTNKVLKIYKTICSSTKIRQEETENIAKKVDLMLIIGSPQSSNTRKLKEIAEKFTKTIFIETKDDLEDISLPEKVGIMAGASAPDYIINDIVEYLNRKKTK